MKPIGRDEILDYVTYGDRRSELRRLAMQAKELRRVVVQDVLTFLFENRDTVRYQIQEMVWTERIVKEADIRHEIDTYNEFLGGAGDLGCTLLIGLDDRAARADKLRAWVELPKHIFVRLPGGQPVYARFDARQLSSERLSSVQFLKFECGGVAPIAVGVDLADLRGETALSAQQQQALAEDLKPSPTAGATAGAT